MVTSLQETLPLKSRMTHEPPSQMFLKAELSENLPSFYSDYITKKQSSVNTNLCEIPNINPSPLYAGIKCEDLLGGILTIGYSETLVMYNDMVNDFSYNNMSNFSNLKRNNALYPAFLEINYVKVCLFTILTNLQNNFI